MIAGVDAAFLRQCHRLASASELPVFIIGMPRSGTSLTEQILASHPCVFGAGEVRFWDSAFVALEKAGLGSEQAASLMPQMARDYLGRLTASAGGALRVIDKMPANFLYAGLIHAAFPRARIIHMQRHPFDTCLSIYFQNFFNMGRYGNDFDDLAHYYGEYVRITDHWRSLLPASALLEVPYEALIADQEGWSRRMLRVHRPALGSEMPRFSPDRADRHHREPLAGAPEDQHRIGRAAGATTKNTWRRCSRCSRWRRRAPAGQLADARGEQPPLIGRVAHSGQIAQVDPTVARRPRAARPS